MISDSFTINVFKTRNGKWCARVSWISKTDTVVLCDKLNYKTGVEVTRYTNDYKSLFDLFSNGILSICTWGCGMKKRKVVDIK